VDSLLPILLENRFERKKESTIQPKVWLDNK